MTSTISRDHIKAVVAKHPARMTMQLARELGVPEVEIVRAFPDNRAVELDAARWEELLTELESFGTVHVIVSNGATTIEAVGRFGGFSTFGEFFNVQTDSLDMHLRFQQLATIFAVEKPSHMSGVGTLSFQFFDQRGDAAFKVFLNFGAEAPAPDLYARFSSFRQKYLQ